MKYILIASFFVLLGCVSDSVIQENRSISFDKVRNIKVNKSDLDSVERLLGRPSDQNKTNENISWYYSDVKTGVPRLTVNFSLSNGKVLDYLWMPDEEDPEYQLSKAILRFKDAVFFEYSSEQTNPHFLDSSATILKDQKSGITIRYDNFTKVVEAIGVYESTERQPASD